MSGDPQHLQRYQDQETIEIKSRFTPKICDSDLEMKSKSISKLIPKSNLQKLKPN